MQLPPHWVLPDGQLAAHAPASHTSVAAHAVPQAPQLLGSMLRSTQLSPHFTKPSSHTKPQAPALQVAVALAGTVQG
jgi:hypothetical protein